MSNVFTVHIPTDIKLGLALPQTGSPHEGQKVRLRPGASPLEINVAEDFKTIPGIVDTNIDNYSIVAASVKVEYSEDSGSSWLNLADAVAPIAGLESSEVTVDTSKLLSDNMFSVSISAGAVPANVLATDATRFRLTVMLTDDAPAPVSGQ